jgi:hypothetical protein
MTLEATKRTHEKLTHEEFASLLTVGNAHVRSSAPLIPAEHSARLIALGYMVYLREAADDHVRQSPDICWATR